MVFGSAGAIFVIDNHIVKLQGCFVVDIPGSEEKVKLLDEEFGFDEVINYKTCTDLKKAIADTCPKAVDIYYDNVGGETSEAVISNINFNARIYCADKLRYTIALRYQ